MTDTPKPGDPEREAYLAEGNARQARKRVAADVLLWNRDGLLLLVNPTYKEGWDLPGGMAEANEAPLDTVKRELAEELGAGVHINGFLCMDWVEPHGPWDDLIAFVFDGGVFDPQQVEQLALKDDELAEYRFFEVAEGLQLLPPRQRARAEHALAALRDGHPRYLQNGRHPWSTAIPFRGGETNAVHSMAYSTRIAHPGEELQQSGHFFRRNLKTLVKLVKGGRDRR